MRCGLLLLCTLVACATTGCASVSESIQQRVAVSEECRDTLATVPVSFGEHKNIVSILAGNVGRCDFMQDKPLLPLCSLTQIRAKYGIGHVPDQADAAAKADLKSKFDTYTNAEGKLGVALDNLVTQTRTLDKDYSDLLKTLRDNTSKRRDIRLSAQDEAVRKIGTANKELRASLTAVHEAHEEMRAAAQAVTVGLPQQAAIEFAAWDLNMRAHLSQLEQLLSGDINLVFNAGIRDEVLTHVARRSLELLHAALKPADAVINRLDDKAHGAVSVSYLALWPKLQAGVNGAYDKVAAVYEERRNRGDRTSLLFYQSASTKAFMWELKRAACDNLTQDTQFSMLSELVDTMLIMKAGDSPPPPPATTTQDHQASPADKAPADGKPISSSPAVGTQAQVKHVKFILPDADVGAGELSRQPEAPPGRQDDSEAVPISPLSVYAVNEWMARQQMLTEKITEALSGPAADRVEHPTPFRIIGGVDEGLVKRIAGAATAKEIDDATRINPSMLNATPTAAGAQIANSVNVAAAAQAVSQASAELTLNLSLSNANAFSAGNYNYNAPTIIMRPSAPLTQGAATPCAAVDFAAIGATCIDSGGSAVLEFSAGHFDSDSCIPRDLEPTLSAIGALLKGYRTRSGTSYSATVQGYASLPTAHMARCKPKTFVEATGCKYVNSLRHTIGIEGCSARPANRNLTLSAARAWVAATALENRSEGAVVVDHVQARGTATADDRGASAPVAIDQTVVIRLTPRVGR